MVLKNRNALPAYVSFPAVVQAYQQSLLRSLESDWLITVKHYQFPIIEFLRVFS